MLPPNPTRLRNRIVLFAMIVGLTAILVAVSAVTVGLPGNERLTADNLASTARALDERATEVSVAATRVTAGTAPRSGPAPVSVDASPARSGVGSRLDPIEPREAFHTVDGLTIQVMDVDPEGWDRVLAENQFNDPPRDNHRMIMVAVQVTNRGGTESEPRRVADSDFRFVGELGIIYTPFGSESRCGVIPQPLDFEIFRNAEVAGNICVQVPADEGDMLLVYRPNSDWDEDTVYFSLGQLP